MPIRPQFVQESVKLFLNSCKLAGFTTTVAGGSGRIPDDDPDP